MGQFTEAPCHPSTDTDHETVISIITAHAACTFRLKHNHAPQTSHVTRTDVSFKLTNNSYSKLVTKQETSEAFSLGKHYSEQVTCPRLLPLFHDRLVMQHTCVCKALTPNVSPKCTIQKQ